jgi:uncharacterized protein YkwD
LLKICGEQARRVAPDSEALPKRNHDVPSLTASLPNDKTFASNDGLSFKASFNGQLSDKVTLNVANLADDDGRFAHLVFEFFADGKRVDTIDQVLSEPGGAIRLDPTKAFDSVRVSAGEDGVTGRIVGVDVTPAGAAAPHQPAPQPSHAPKPVHQPKPAPEPAHDGDADAFELGVIRLTNAERAKHGLPALHANKELNAAADAHAEDMARNDYFSHISRNGDKPWDRAEDFGYDSRGFGENIASGHTSPEQVMRAWMNSPPHRANILSERFHDIGVGYDHNQWVQDFGTGDLDPYTALA